MNVPTCEYSKEQRLVKELALVKGSFRKKNLKTRGWEHEMMGQKTRQAHGGASQNH
jgi:hypothetical protein